MTVKLRIRPDRTRRPWSWMPCGVALALAGGCGGDDGEPMDMSEARTTVRFGASDPCTSPTPRPTDLFFDARGLPEALCDLPDDPLDAAVARVEQSQRASLDPTITIPLDGSLDVASLSSTVGFGFDGGGGAADGLPPVVLIERTATATTPGGAGTWRAIDVSANPSDDGLEVVPGRSLVGDRLHVVVATRALRDAEATPAPLAQSGVVAALLGDAPISTGSAGGLDAEAAARLERQRLALAGAVQALAGATPPITPEDVVSIHAFTTRPGDALLERIAARYDAARQAGAFPFTVRIDETDIPPSQVYEPTARPQDYPNVASFLRGAIMVPRLLDQEARLRPDWDTAPEMIAVPFLMSLPRQGGPRIPVAVQVVGYGRSRVDARALANAMGGAPAGAALAIELRCHGARSPGADGVCRENRSAAEIEALEDLVSNNGNPLFNGADGIPDASGNGFFPGDPLKLRDTQVAAMVEIIHVVGTLRASGTNPFAAADVQVDGAGVHLVAQGYTALPAAAAAGFASISSFPRTVQFPSGGADLPELILEGAEDQREAFEAGLPEGVRADQARTLLGVRLADFFAPLEVDSYADRLIEQRYRPQGQRRGLLLPHPRSGNQGTTQFVSADARTALRQALDLPSRFVSEHRARCDDYFVFTCVFGDDPAILEEARAQIAGFISSNGATVPPPF